MEYTDQRLFKTDFFLIRFFKLKFFKPKNTEKKDKTIQDLKTVNSE